MSPETSIPSTKKHCEPGVWPGVWMSVIADRADLDDVARLVQHEIGVRAAGDALHAERFGRLHVDLGGDVGAAEQLGDALDAQAHHVPADVIGVVVGGEHAGEAHPVGAEDLDELVDAVGGIDQHGLAGLAVADEVDEVDHLLGDPVGAREVAPGEQLAEVQAISHRLAA